MNFAVIETRIEQPLELVELRVISRDIRSLKGDARETAQRGVINTRCPAVLLRADVVNLEGTDVELLRHPAVLEAPAGSIPDLLTTGPCHTSGCFRSAQRSSGLGLRQIDQRTDAQVTFEFVALFL